MNTAKERKTHKDRSLISDLILAGLGILLLVPVLQMVFTELDPSRPAGAKTHSVIGELSHSTNSVRRRHDGMLVWNQISISAPIFQRDAIYAGTDSEAVISLEDGSRIVLDENSMAVVQSQTPGDDVSRSTTRVVVDVIRGSASGESRGRKLAIRAGKARLALKKGSRAKVRVQANQSARIDVLGGQAVVKTEGQSPKELSAGQRGQVDQKGQVATRELPVALLAPEEGRRIYFTDKSPELEFRWRTKQATAPCLFEISRDAGFEKMISSRSPDEPRVRIPELPEGSFYWRVRCNPDSANAQVSEERKLSLIVDLPPVLYRPGQGELVFLPGKKSLLFAWSRVPDVESYQIEITRDARAVVSQQVTNPQYRHLGGMEEGHYCFRARAVDPQRGQPLWSQPACFRVINRPVPRAPRLFDPKVEKVPAKDKVIKPPRGSWLWRLVGGVAHADEKSTRAIVLRWEAVPGIKTYILEIAEDQEFQKVVVQKKLNHNYFRWHTLTHRTYFWRVKSVDASGRPGEFGKPKVIGAVVSGPPALAPKPGTEILLKQKGVAVQLRWRKSELLASHKIQISRDPGFNQAKSHNVRRQNTMTYQATETGKYYWRVIGIDLNGRKTRPGKPGSFEVRIARPRTIRPANQAELVWESEEHQVKLSWSPRPARRYQVQLANNPRFRKAKTRSTGRASLVHRPQGMGNLYWRVRCQDPESEWSKAVRFRLVPMTPEPQSPAADKLIKMTADSATVEFSWQGVLKAAAYRLEVSRMEPQRIEGTRTTMVLPTGLYSWSVRALDSQGIESAPSRPRNLELRAPGLPGEVVLSTPADGTRVTHQARQPVALVWQPAERAVGYELELASDKDFKRTLQRSKVNATRTEVSVTPAQTVHWRIRALNQAGHAGGWSASRNFSYQVVAPPPPKIIKPAPPGPPAVHLAPHLSFFYNLGAVSTLRYGLEFSYRLPVWERRLAVSLLTSYYTASASASAAEGELAADSRIHSIPLDLVLSVRFPTSVVDPYLGTGLNMCISHALVSMATQPELRQTDVDFGFIAVGGLEIPLGPGAAFVEFRYALATHSAELVEIDPGGLTFGAGYRIGIW